MSLPDAIGHEEKHIVSTFFWGRMHALPLQARTDKLPFLFIMQAIVCAGALSGARVRDAFNAGLKTIRADSSYEATVKQYVGAARP